MDMRKAKIVCTLGPSSNTRKVIGELIGSGMDVARLNFSHGEYPFHEKIFRTVRSEAARLNKAISILQDLQGIKIRVGDVEGGRVHLKIGSQISLYAGKELSTAKAIYISYPALVKDANEGESIVIDDGILKLTVVGKKKDSLVAKVVEGGVLKSRKGVNLPCTRTTLEAFTEKDRRDLQFGLGLGFDYVAVSFVRQADDILRVTDWARKNKVNLPPIIAKIEKPKALDNIEEIMEVVDGIMVARGDLGVEMATEQVPVIQKMLIDLANMKGKVVITATQMLESMTQHTRPTRAEASDVANAILDGTDAVMLSGETASGKYPVEAVRVMDSIIRNTEVNFPDRLKSLYKTSNKFPESIAVGACMAAQSIGAKLIVVFTHSGFAAMLLSKLRPSVPVVAFTPSKETLHRIPLYWGAMSRLISSKDIILEADLMSEIEKSLVEEGLIKKGNSIVFVASSPFLGKPNIIRLHKVT